MNGGQTVKKRFLLLLLAALVVTTLVACSDSEQQSQPNAAGTATKENTQEEQANLELTQVAFDTAKAELISGNYDVALAAFKEVELMISLNEVEGFDDLEAYKYACNYYRLSEYLSGFSFSAKYAASDSFSVIASDAGSGGILISYEGTSVTGGYYSSSRNEMVEPEAHFINFMINIPAPDMEAPTIPEQIKWIYASSDALNGFAPIAKASGTINPQDWFTFERKDSESVLVGTILEINTQSGPEDEINMNPKSYCRSLLANLNSFFAATELNMTVTDLGFRDIDAELKDFMKNN